MSSLAWLEPCSPRFANPLAEPAPWRPDLPSAWRLLAALTLICLLSRGLMAWKLDVLTEDAPVYITAASCLEQGDFDTAFRVTNLGLNVFPIVLMGLHKLGLDWEIAGRLWGALVSTLVVPPMFAWTRRQFNDRLAAVGCLLYTAHPALLERSPETLRCPTFWLLLVLTLYFLWRATAEVRLRHFLAAGLFFTLGLYTRVETWLCLVPWVLWTFWRWQALQSSRGRLVTGSLLGLALVPLLTVAVNVTWLRHHTRWETCMTQRLLVLVDVLQWHLGLQSVAVPNAAAQPDSSVSPASNATAHHASVPFGLFGISRPKPWTWRVFIIGYVRKLVDAVDYTYGLLLLLGLIHWRSVFLRRDHQAICLMNLTCLALVMMFWYFVQDIQGRYFFPIVLTTTHWAAGGLFGVAQAAAWLAGKLRFAWEGRAALASWVLLGTAITLGWADALTNNYDDRRERVALGRWILQTLGPGQVIFSPEPGSMLLSYYAQARQFRLPSDEIGTTGFQTLVNTEHPSVFVILSHEGKRRDASWRRQFEADEELSAQFREVSAETLPPKARWSTVYVRTAAWQGVATRASTSAR